MSSGFGLRGNVSRCFYHFQDFSKCMKNDEEPLTNCKILRDDYLECLHNRKLVLRKEAIKQQEILNKAGGAGGGAHGSGGGGHH